MKIPRKNTEQVKEILSSDKTNQEKAEEILYFHKNCLARETDGYIKNEYTVEGILRELES